MARGVCTEVLQVLRPDATESGEEDAEDRAAVQQVRGAERVAHLEGFPQVSRQSHVLDVPTAKTCPS